MPPPQANTTSVPSVYQPAILVLISSRGAEDVGVPVLDLNLDASFLGSGVSALHKAEAKADNRRNGHAAQEAQLGVAVLDSGVTGQIAGLLFLIEDGVGVRGWACRVGGGIQHDKGHFGVQRCTSLMASANR